MRAGGGWWNFKYLFFNYFNMAYGFAFSRTNRDIILDKTHDWRHQWKKILKLNGLDITILSWSQVDLMLQEIETRKEAVRFLLESWELVSFWPDSVLADIWFGRPIIPGTLPEWTSYRVWMEASADGKTILAGTWRPWTQVLKDAFRH
jgi:hypothetical protein